VTAGRGRPPVFDQVAQDEYLRLLTHGVRVGEAADKLGISRRTPNQHAARDPHFAQQLAVAKAGGRKNRLKHGDAGTYNHHGCRCAPCTTAAANARTQHRHGIRADDEPNTTAQVHSLPTPQPLTATTKLLVLADVG
jgi:hypothetical protein